QFQGRHGDVAAHGLAVDDRPARLPDLLQKQLAGCGEVFDEQVGLVLASAIARCDPRVPFGKHVTRDRQHAEIAAARTALNAVREDDEPPAPALWDLVTLVGAPGRTP